MSNYDTAVLNDSPIVYYRFEETSGTPTDETGTTSVSTTTGIPNLDTSSKTGELGSAVRFAGDDWYVLDTTISSLGIDGSKSRTIECWAFIELFDNAGALWDFGGNGGTDAEDFSLRTWDGDNKLKLQLWGVDITFTSSQTLLNTWRHFVVTYDGSTVRVLIDTVEEASGSRSLSTLGTENARIGIWQDESVGLTGKVDEVAVYDYVLSDSRIQAHFTASTFSGNFSGTVEGETAGSTIAALVRAYREDTGAFVDEFQMDGTQSSYSLNTGVNTTHTIVALPPDGSGLPARVKHDISPSQ